MKGLFSLLPTLLLSFGLSAQQPAATDFHRMEAEIQIIPSKKAVSGEILLEFDILEQVDSIFIDAQKMDFSDVSLNGKPVKFGSNEKKFWITGDFSPSKDQKLRLNYSATPQQAMYFISKNNEGTEVQDYQVWTQGQGKYTSHWLPSFDDPTEKLEFDLSFIYPSEGVLVSNGELVDTQRLNHSLVRYSFNMDKPMSSYLVAVAAGNFDREINSQSETPILLFYPRGMKDRVEPTYRHSAFLMDFFEAEIGVNYPWQNYKQVPVRDFLYAGMENTGTTIFSDIFLVDSIGYNDRNYVNVNAHELAHQWFGNLVTAKNPEDHWLQEGFSTYYALLAEKEIFGEEYFYWKLFKTAEELKQLSDSGKGEAVVSEKASSLTYYQKGAWALHILKERIGEEAFHRGVKNYLEKYKFSSASTRDLLAEMESASGLDLSDFEKDWLRQSAFQGTEALESLKRSAFIQKYLELAAAKPLPISEKRDLLRRALSFPVNDYLGQEAVLQLSLEDPLTVIDLYKKAFSSGNLRTRQAIAFSLNNVPQQLKKDYESLLEDESYITQETAFYNLWISFPQERMKYLQIMRGKEGFLDKNLRTLWLTLSLATQEVSFGSKVSYIDELREYTAPHYRFQLRENAFGYLYQLDAFDEKTLENLEDATKHHTYSFRKFARQLQEQLAISNEQ